MSQSGAASALCEKRIEDFDATRCLQMTQDVHLIAAQDGRCWVMRPGASCLIALPVSAVAAHSSSFAASLLEGAIRAGLTERVDAAAPPYTLLGYIRWLVGNYIFAGQTPGLFLLAAESFERSGRRDLADFARGKAREEDGHANLAYLDLEALGLPASQTIQALAPPSSKVFAERFRSYVESSEPIALFGFSYCLERMAAERDEAFIEKVMAVCPPGSHAFRFLKVHSAIGSDKAHVDEQLAFFERLSEGELAIVARAAHATGQLLARQAQIDAELSDDEIERRLLTARVEVKRGLLINFRRSGEV